MEVRARDARVRDAMDALRRMVQALRLSSRGAEKEAGVSGAQLFVLQTIDRDGPRSIGELAKSTATHQSSVSTVVSRLCDAGLAVRTRSPHDGRRQVVRLTREGRRVLRELPEAPQVRLVRALQALPPRRLDALVEELDALVRRLGLEGAPPSLFFEESPRRRTR